MKVITKSVVIRNREFVLIEDTQNGHHFFGTIPYEELDENGRMKRALNGFQMCIGYNNIAEALKRREDAIKIDEWQAQNPNATEIDRINFIMSI